MANLADILLRVLGDPRGGERALADVTRDLKKFDAQEGEAEATLDTTQFRLEIKQAIKMLEQLDREEADPEVDLQIADALAEAKRIDRELTKAARDRDSEFDVETAAAQSHLRELNAALAVATRDRDVNVDVDVDRGALERVGAALGGIAGGLGKITGLSSEASSGLGDVGTQAGGASTKLGGMGGAASSAASAIGGAMFIAIGAAVTALAALAASATFAVGALGALAVAAGALAIPVGGLLVGAIVRFKDTVDEAGTAANRLKTVAGDLGNQFKGVLGPAADAVFRGITAGLKELGPALPKLKGAFLGLGQAVGNSARRILSEFAKPGWTNFFKRLTQGASSIVPPLTTVFIRLLRILRNIANAALPFVVKGLKAAADGLGGFAKGTGNVQKTGKVIGQMVNQLQAWLRLTGSLVALWIEFSTVIEKFGGRLLDWLRKGIDGIREWVRSAEGQERIKQFFKETMPLVKQLVTFLGKLAIVFIQAFQTAAPAITAVLKILNGLLDAIIFLQEAWLKLSPATRAALSPVMQAANGLMLLWGWAKKLVAAFPAIGHAASSAFNSVKNVTVNVFGAIKQITGTVWNAIKQRMTNPIRAAASILRTVFGAMKDAAKKIWSAIKAIANTVWGAIKGLIAAEIRGAQRIFKAVLGVMKDVARTVWNAIKAVTSAVWGAIKKVIGDRIRDALSIVRSVANTIKTVAKNAWDAVKNAASAAWGKLKEIIRNALNAVKNAIRDSIGSFRKLGSDIGNAIATGIKSAISSAVNAAKDLADKVKGALGKAFKLLSPSKVAIDMGQKVAKGLAIGLQDSLGAEKAAKRMAGRVTGGMASGLAAQNGSGGVTQNNITITPLAVGELPDPEALLAQLEMAVRVRAAR